MVGFEWDEEKRKANLKKHGIDFRRAVQIFERPYYRKRSYAGSDTVRYMAVGEVAGKIWTVIYTTRSNHIRIISARKARYEEKEAYRALYDGSDQKDARPH